jgi:hypothetical protein
MVIFIAAWPRRRCAMKRIMALGAILVLTFAGYTIGEVPQTISYQGVLKDDEGGIVPEGDYDFTFRIYDVLSGGTALWTEDQTKHVTSGILNVILGDISPIDLPFDAPYWLGVTIGTGDELVPRTPLTGSPYALNAQAVIGTHNIFPDSGAVGVGTTTPGSALHVVSPDIHVMELEGTAAGSWALLDINAAGIASNPGIEYFRQGTLKAVTFVGSGDDLVFRVGANDALRLESGTANCGIGVADPLERLDVAGAVRLGTTGDTNAGAIRWTGTDFEGYDGGTWLSLTSAGGGTLPAGSIGQTIRHNGSDWVASSLLYNDGDRIGIGTTSPTAELEIMGDNMTNHFKLSASTGAGPALYLNAVNKDWTIYGSNPGSSAGDQKLVFRDFSSAEDRVVIDAEGDVGIGVMNPLADLHIKGGYWTLDEEGGDLIIGSDLYQLRFGILTTTGWAGTAGIRVDGGYEWLTLSCGDEETLTLIPGGRVFIGYPDMLDCGFAAGPHGAWGSCDSLGGTIGIAHYSTGYASGYIRSIYDDFACEMRLARGLDELEYPKWGFEVICDHAGSESPHVYITGEDRAALFKMNYSDDESVQLPVNAISSGEILDEPGAASATEGISMVELDGSIQTVLYRTITVPAAGCVQVIATTQTTINHTVGVTSEATFGVSDIPGGFPGNQDVLLSLPQDAATGIYYYPVTVHGLFEVASQGSYTFYFLGMEGGGDVDLYDMQLTLLYVPTLYGTVSPTTVAGGAVPDERAPIRLSISRADLTAEREESAELDRERIERELEDMRERIRELEAAVSRDSYVRSIREKVRE